MNILLIDDEPAVISTVSFIVNNKCNTEAKVFTAQSREEAISIIKKTKMDLVITDIRLGNDNGLELAKEIIDYCPSCAIVILSAHDRKDYLKTALSLNVLRYIQKPIRASEIIEVVELVASRPKVREEDKYSPDVFVNYEKMIDILVSRKYQAIERRSLIQSLDNKEFLNYKNFVSVAVKISERIHNLDILKLVIGATSNEKMFCIGKKKTDSVFIFLTASDNNGLKNLTEQWMRNIFLNDLKGEAHICIGNQVQDHKDICVSYVNTCSVLEKAFYMEKGVHTYEDAVESDSKKRSDVSAAFDLGAIPKDEEGFLSYLHSTYENIKADASIPSGTTRLLFLNIINYMIMTSQNVETTMEIDMNEINHKDFLTIDELYEFTKQTVVDSGVFLESDQLAYRVKDYIKQNYREPELCVESIAEYFYVSTTHLTRLFKKTFDVSVGQYIINVRISVAKKMLDLYDTDIRTVAESVGYSDPNYFSRIFKQKTGMTVSEFKKSKK